MNTPVVWNPNAIQLSAEYLESLQEPKLRAGGASSSHLLNRMFSRVKKDLVRLQVDVEDATDNTRIQALLIAQQNQALGRLCSGLQAQLTALPSTSTATADFYLNGLTTISGTTADVNPLFGQVILPAKSRQNVLVIERGTGEPNAIPQATRLQVALQPSVTSTLDATAPADYLFGEDVYSVFALDGDDRTFWPIEDTTTTPHVAWIEIDLPSDVSGSQICNELEIVPTCPNTDLFAVQAEVIGSGWQDLDFSYLVGYDQTVNAVHNLGPARLCFAKSNITRIRLGLWVSGFFGFYSIRCLLAQYQNSGNVLVNFSSKTSDSLTATTLLGKNPTQLGYLPVSVSGQQLTVTLQPAAATTETPVLTGITATW